MHNKMCQIKNRVSEVVQTHGFFYLESGLSHLLDRLLI